MIIAVILLGVIQVIAFVGLGWFIRLYFEGKQAEIEARIDAELKRLVAGEPCQVASVLNAVGRVVGGEAGRSAKASLMADLSHASRVANNDASAAEVDAVSGQSPVLGGALASLGRGGSSKLLKNPLIQLALSALLNRSSGGNGSESTVSSGSVRDRLQKGG